MRKAVKRWTLILAAVLLLLLGAVLALRPDWRYLCADAVTRPGRHADMEPLDTDALPMGVYTLEQLEAAGVEPDRSLMLINSDYHIPDDFEPQLTDYHDTGVLMDEAMAADFAALSQAVQERFGEKLLVRSSYRTREEQEETIELDGDVAASLDASEHQAGLALDVYVPGYAGRAFLKTEAGRWVNDHCWEYGFILRYPYYGVAETGIPYEPWHLRYVGRPHAELMAQNSWTLEKYEKTLAEGTFWQYQDVIITRQSREPFTLPADWKEMTVSPDNQGGYVFTLTVGE